MAKKKKNQQYHQMIGLNLYESTWKCRDALTYLMLQNLLPLQLLCFMLFDLISVISAAIRGHFVLHPGAGLPSSVALIHSDKNL